MFSESTIWAMVKIAGLYFDWPDTKSWRLTSDARQGLRIWLREFQNGMCAFCGEELNDSFDLCHIVSGGKNRLGWLAGNIAAGCRECNEIDAEISEIVRYDSIVRPDLIATEWPATPILARMGKAWKQELETRKERKRAKRGL